MQVSKQSRALKLEELKRSDSRSSWRSFVQDQVTNLASKFSKWRIRGRSLWRTSRDWIHILEEVKEFCNLLYKFSFNCSDTKFVCTNFWHARWDNLCLSSLHFQSLLQIKLLQSKWLPRRMPPTTLLSTSLLSTNLLPCLHEQILRSTQLRLQVSMFLAINMAQGERSELWHNYMARHFQCSTTLFMIQKRLRLRRLSWCRDQVKVANCWRSQKAIQVEALLIPHLEKVQLQKQTQG